MATLALKLKERGLKLSKDTSQAPTIVENTASASHSEQETSESESHTEEEASLCQFLVFPQ